MVQASSTEFSGSDFKVSLWFQSPPAASGELICDPFVPFLSANVSPVPPKVISSLSLALCLKLLARSVCVRVLLLEFVSTFLFRLVPTLVSLVSSVCSLSALFLSSWFLASLVGFGYLAFTQRQTFLGVFLLFLPLPCCLFYLFFVASFLLVYGLLRSWNWLISAIVSYPPICVLYYGVVHMHVSFVCYCFSRVDLCLHNSERIGLPRGRVCFVYLCFSALRSLQGMVANGPRNQRPGKP